MQTANKGQLAIEARRGTVDTRMTTDEILALTRDETAQVSMKRMARSDESLHMVCSYLRAFLFKL